MNLKPGEYNLKAKLKGYNSLDENVLIPVGSTGLSIEKLMVAIFRDVIPEITSDFTGIPLNQIFLTLGEMPVENELHSNQVYINLLLIKKDTSDSRNYQYQPRSQSIFTQIHIMQSRQLKLAIKSSFNDAKSTQSKLLLNTTS